MNTLRPVIQNSSFKRDKYDLLLYKTLFSFRNLNFEHDSEFSFSPIESRVPPSVSHVLLAIKLWNKLTDLLQLVRGYYSRYRPSTQSLCFLNHFNDLEILWLQVKFLKSILGIAE